MTIRNRAAALLLALAACSPWLAAAERPNILFVIADDWGNGHGSVFGTPWLKTPAFDRIAKEGVLFTNAYTSNPKCSPSRATMLTGRNTWQLKEAINHFSIFPGEFPTFPDLLEEAGYFVGYTGKGWAPGDWRAGGRDRNPAGPEFNSRKLKPPHRGISNKDYAGNFEDFLAARPKDKPFCFWLGTHEPHRSYEDGAGRRAGKDIRQVKLPAYYPDSDVIRSDFLDYAIEVEWFDSHLGRAIRKLEEIGELDNTFILVTSDHGEPFPRVKGQIYERGFHIPLAVRWAAKVPGGRVIDDFINARDFAPTILEAAGLEPAGTMTGSSFLGLLTSGKSGWIDPERSVMLIGKERHDLGRPHDWGYPVRAIRTKEWLYIRNYNPERWPAGNPETGYRNCDASPTKWFLLSRFDRFYRLSFGKRPAEELYRVDRDPDNVENLAQDPRYARIKRELRERMEEMLRSEGDPRMLGNEEFFETIDYTGSRRHAWDTWLRNQDPAHGNK